ncbi:hypothetical protein WA577_003396, partial [Blastocystis sp. JDR]
MQNETVYSEAKVDIMCEFFEVIIHQFFYYSHYYENMFFDRKMKYGTVIYVCRVQEVVDYVKELVSSLRKWMLRNVLKAVSLTIHDIEGREIESFVIIQSENTLRVTDAIDFDRLEESLRSTLLLFSATSFCPSLPDNSQFSVSIDTNKETEPKSMDGWEFVGGSDESFPVFSHPENKSIHSVSTVFAGFSSYQFFVSLEKSDDKGG